MHKLASRWACDAVLYLPGKPDDDSRERVLREGTLSEMIAFAVETLPLPQQTEAHIRCGDVLLGREAIHNAYHCADFPQRRDMPNRAGPRGVVMAYRPRKRQ